MNVDGTQASGNTISSNNIFNSAELGIDLDGDGVTANDPGDGDTGPNGLQNYPVIDLAESAVQGQATISDTLNSQPNTIFTLEFFYSAAADGSGFGEGEVYFGAGQAMTDGSGDTTFEFAFSRTLPPNAFVTATATDPAGNTSEFSAAYGPAAGILDDPITDLAANCTPASCEVLAGTAIDLYVSITSGTGVYYSWDLGDNSTAAGQAITHSYTTPGVYTATVTAANNNNSGAASVAVTVLDPKQPPVVDAGPDQIVDAGSPVTLDGTGSNDPGGNTLLTYQWTQTASPGVILSDPAAPQPMFTAPGMDSILTFELVVTNTLALESAPDTVTITVEASEIFLPIILK